VIRRGLVRGRIVCNRDALLGFISSEIPDIPFSQRTAVRSLGTFLGAIPMCSSFSWLRGTVSLIRSQIGTARFTVEQLGVILLLQEAF
jgi:hypothetical protein